MNNIAMHNVQVGSHVRDKNTERFYVVHRIVDGKAWVQRIGLVPFHADLTPIPVANLSCIDPYQV